MECLIPAHYTEAMTAVCRSLSYLAAKKREEGSEEYKIEYSIQGRTAVTGIAYSFR